MFWTQRWTQVHILSLLCALFRLLSFHRTSANIHFSRAFGTLFLWV